VISFLTQFAAILVIALIPESIQAFSPVSNSPISIISRVPHQMTTLTQLNMADGEEGEPKKKDLYDDEIEVLREPQLSETMRERLLRESQVGLDSESKQTNVILYVSIAIALLIGLGGKGILF